MGIPQPVCLCDMISLEKDTWSPFKGIFHPKWKLSSFTHSHVILNMYDFLFQRCNTKIIWKMAFSPTQAHSQLVTYWSLVRTVLALLFDAQGSPLASLFRVKGPPLFSLVCLNLMVCMQFLKKLDSFIQMFTFLGAPKETLNIKKYTKCYSTLRTDCSTQEVFTADRDGDRIYSAHKSIVLPQKTWNIDTFKINDDGSCICLLYLVFYWQMVGLWAGVGLCAQKFVNNVI